MSDTAIALVCVDLAALIESADNVTETAFAEAIATQGIVSGTAAYTRAMVQVDRTRGYPPVDVMHQIFADDEVRARAANLAFERSYRTVVDRFGTTVTRSARDALDAVTGMGTRVCLISGLSRAVFDVVLDAFEAGRLVDLTLCRDEVPRGCPWPDPVFTAVMRTGGDDVRQVAVVGNTAAVLLGGVRAGAAVVAGVRAGARAPERLRRAGATHLVDTIGDLPDLLTGQGERWAVGRPRG